MSLSFRHEAGPEGVRFELQRKTLLGRRPLPLSEWTGLGDRTGAAARFLVAAMENGEARPDRDGVLVPHAIAASLPGAIAEALGLPPLGTLSLTIAIQGIMTDPRSRIRASWYDADTRRIQIARQGALATWGKVEGRLSTPVFHLAEAIDAYNATEGAASDRRIAAWASVQAALKGATGEAVSSKDEFLTSLTLYQAGAVALDVIETSNGPDFLPVVMGREKAPTLEDDVAAPEGTEESPPAQRDLLADALLPQPLQQRFAREMFAGEQKTRDAYVIARNTYLVIDPALKTALDVIRRKRAAPRSERAAFLRNPRAEIAAALGEDAGDAARLLLVETWQYSERVLGLAIWEPPAMPWLKNRQGQWMPESFPINIGGEIVELDEPRFEELRTAVAKARAEELSEVVFDNRRFELGDVERAFERLGLDPQGNPAAQDDAIEAPAPPEEGPGDVAAAPQDERLVIRQNLDGNEFEIAYTPRTLAPHRGFPSRDLVATEPKPHQMDGFDWLVDGYRAGWPGMLLADDMGLGKTFQALAFLASVRACRRIAMAEGAVQRKPFLIVAPTALLTNWIEEASRHLAPAALGTRVDAFGSALRHLKTPKSAEWTPETALDVPRLRSADWVLTTYETLADNHRAFARVSFSIALFDEAQKIKSPGAINTQSAKAVNADFVLALTGTPIENRLADLWCIMDRVVPGYLGDLKSFVAHYEDGDDGELSRLKSKLDRPPDARTPPVLLRRMKTEILVGLPDRKIETLPVTMPPAQAEAYAEAVARARAGGGSQGEMLRAIHAFRGISLHPDGATGCDPLDPASVRSWIGRSARTAHAVGVLERLHSTGEKALLFLEDLEIQKLFSVAIATHLRLDRQPAIIIGSVAGEKRQEIVERFQSAPPGFDLLVLSPKAAGIGLTITAANHVIHLSRWWNPAVEDQCNDRCYRIGQERPVTIHIPIARHPRFGDDSFDVRLDALLEQKRRLSRDMLMPPVSDGDVRTLFGETIRPTAASH